MDKFIKEVTDEFFFRVGRRKRDGKEASSLIPQLAAAYVYSWDRAPASVNDALRKRLMRELKKAGYRKPKPIFFAEFE